MRARLVAAIAVAIALCGCVPVVSASQLPPTPPTDVIEDMPRQNGMPLDAISYDTPAWMPGCYEAYRIYDRANGQQWWVLAIQNGKYDTSYVVLPIGDGNDAL